MDLNELYKRSGSWIVVRGQIQKEITELQSQPDRNSRRNQKQLQSLNEQYDRVQVEIMTIEREINRLQNIRSSNRQRA